MESESSYDADELGQYQSLSTLAVLTLLLGLLSSVAFLSGLLLVVPLFAVAVALGALAKIKRSEGGLLGARLAYFGLTFAIVFGVASVARTQVRIQILRHQATATAELWLSRLAQGQAEEALDLMTMKAKSKIGNSDEADVPTALTTVPIFEAGLREAQLLQDPLAAALIAIHQSGKKTLFQSVGHLVSDSAKPRVVLYYRFLDSQPEESLFVLSLVKTGGNFAPSLWLLDAWSAEGVTLP